jgi:hypothetical protein
MRQVARRADDGLMPPGVNVALQLIALLAALAIRLAEPGRLVLSTVAFVLPLLVALLPLGLALRTAHRRPLPRAVAGPFVATAIALVVVALMYPELDGRGSWVTYLIGNSGLCAYVAALMWTLVAVEETSRNDHERRSITW